MPLGVHSLKSKLLLTCIGVIILQIVLVSLLAYGFLSKMSEGIQEVLLDYATTRVQGDLSQKYAGHKRLLAEMAIDPTLRQLFVSLADNASDDKTAVIVKNTIAQRFSEYAQSHTDVSAIFLMQQEQATASYYRKQNGYSLQTQNSKDEIANRLSSYQSENFDNGIQILAKADAEGETHHYFIYPAVDLITHKQFGLLCLEVEPQSYDIIASLAAEKTELQQYVMPESSITDAESVVVSSSVPGNIGKPFSATVSSGAAIVKKSDIVGTDFSLHLAFRRALFQSSISQFGTIMLALNLVLVLAFTAFIYITISRAKANAQKIALAISDFRESKQKSHIEFGYSDNVFAAVADQFNLMSAEIEGLLHRLEEKNEHIIKVKDQQRISEIKALQAQINPHFIYNALDRINWEAIDGEQYAISTMLNELASLLRYSISNINILVPLSVELEWMEKYFHIQGERFGRPIVIHKAISEAALDFPIYKMLLQPIVENSIIHGFDSEMTSLTISIEAKLQAADSLHLILSDNGLGMNAETLALVKRTLRQHGEQDEDGIGVANVASRLWHCYGENSSISVDSQLGKGTEFTIIIPRAHQ